MALGKEPTLIIQSAVAALNAVQIAAISMSPGLHTAIAVASIGLGAVLNRSQVTPAMATPTAPDPHPPVVAPAPPPSVPPTQGA